MKRQQYLQIESTAVPTNRNDSSTYKSKRQQHLQIKNDSSTYRAKHHQCLQSKTTAAPTDQNDSCTYRAKRQKHLQSEATQVPTDRNDSSTYRAKQQLYLEIETTAGPARSKRQQHQYIEATTARTCIQQQSQRHNCHCYVLTLWLLWSTLSTCCTFSSLQSPSDTPPHATPPLPNPSAPTTPPLFSTPEHLSFYQDVFNQPVWTVCTRVFEGRKIAFFEREHALHTPCERAENKTKNLEGYSIVLGVNLPTTVVCTRFRV